MVVIILILTGVCGNVLVIIATTSKQSIRSSVNSFIISLAVADLCSSLGMSFIVISLINGKWSYNGRVCNFNGFSNVTFSLASALTVSAISVNLFLATRGSVSNGNTLLMKKRRHLFLFTIWIFAIVLAFLPILGWSRYEYFPTRGICFWKYSTSKSYTTTFYVIAAPACLTATVAYWKIYNFLRARKRRVIPSLNRETLVATLETERKITISIFLVLFTYYTTLTPFTLLNIIESSNPLLHIPPWIDLGTYLLAMSNHVNNVFIYSIMMRKYRKTFSSLFCLSRCIK